MPRSEIFECKPADHCSPLDHSSFCRPQAYWVKSTVLAFWETKGDSEVPTPPCFHPPTCARGPWKTMGKMSEKRRKFKYTNSHILMESCRQHLNHRLFKKLCRYLFSGFLKPVPSLWTDKPIQLKHPHASQIKIIGQYWKTPEQSC